MLQLFSCLIVVGGCFYALRFKYLGGSSCLVQDYGMMRQRMSSVVQNRKCYAMSRWFCFCHTVCCSLDTAALEYKAVFNFLYLTLAHLMSQGELKTTRYPYPECSLHLPFRDFSLKTASLASGISGCTIMMLYIIAGLPRMMICEMHGAWLVRF